MGWRDGPSISPPGGADQSADGGHNSRVGVSPRASEIWDRAEAMLEVPGDLVLTDELEDLIDR
jgi:hypothetical protein